MLFGFALFQKLQEYVSVNLNSWQMTSCTRISNMEKEGKKKGKKKTEIMKQIVVIRNLTLCKWKK